tara:strand:- start:169 stop:315 length:147 start_codon:yes stop_codon:yes gene_type:complete
VQSPVTRTILSAHKLIEYQNKRGGNVTFSNINDIKTDWDTNFDVLQAF